MDKLPYSSAMQDVLGKIGGASGTDTSQAPSNTSAAMQSVLSKINTQEPSSVQGAVADSGDQNFDGYCQAFVEQQTLGHTGVYGSASAAYQDQAQKGNVMTDTSKLQPGAILYFSPNESNGGDGHTGLYMGNGQFISATDDGVKPEDINQWQQATGQQLLGFSGGYK